MTQARDPDATKGTARPARPRRWHRAAFLIWLAFLAFGLPEVIAGSSNLWLTSAGAWILTIPLYFLHFLFLVQVALITRRRSWPALYLLGVAYGLYETWITKVVWAGYLNGDGLSFGGIGPADAPWFGLHESLGLVFFYHPVLSFLLPLAVLTRLVPAWGRAFPAPDWVFGTGRWAVVRRLGLFAVLAPVTAANDPVPPVYLATWLPLVAILWPGWLVLRRSGIAGSAASRPRVGRAGLAALVLGLGVLYALTFGALRPEVIPPMAVRLGTAALYPVLALMLWRTRPTPDFAPAPIARPGALPLRWFLGLFVAGLGLDLAAAGGIDLRGMLAPFAFLAMMPLGAGLFVWLGLWRGLIMRG